MKRLWIGIIVLSLLLATGLGAAYLLDRSVSPIRETLTQAVSAALSERADQANDLISQAETQWVRSRKWTTILVEQDILEEAAFLFAEAKIYGLTGEHPQLAATCARLAELMDAIAQSHQTIWQNVL